MASRKMIYNGYIVEDPEWIAEQINKIENENPGRKMHITIDKSNYGETGYILFSLQGSPPRGCAVYNPSRQWIIFINTSGKTKKFNNTTIDLIKLNKWQILQAL